MQARKLTSAVFAVVLITISGCAGVSERAASPDGPARTSMVERKLAGGAHAGWLYARTVYENPINRPFSHASSLASLAFKSAGGALRRTSIATVQMPALRGEIPAISNAEPMDLKSFERTLDRVTGTRSDKGTIRFLVDGDEYFCRLMSKIDNAESSIDIRTYIFDNDDVAVEIADRLRARANEVRVRVMLDSLGTLMALQTDPDSLPDAHEVPLSIRGYFTENSDIKVRSTTNPWFTGDHTKTTIIDRETAFVGGMNIGREYRYDWHDLMMEVNGPVVDKLQFESDKAWARAGLFGDLGNVFAFLKGKKAHADDVGYPIRVLQTRNFDSDIYKAQIAAIQNARRYILIQNAYFSDDRTVYELAKARRRGVDVRVIIPARGNHGALGASNKITINTLLEHGVRVYEYPGMSHVKAAIYDGWASVGSANFDKLSLKVNKELNLATSDPETVQALMKQVFIPDMLASRELKSTVEVTVATRLVEMMVDELL